MTSYPLVSILIPTYNRAGMIPRALESVLSQTYTNFEAIVVDNASSDNTIEIVDTYIRRDDRIKFFHYKETVPPVENWRRCLEHSQGDFIKIVWSDDWIDSTAIERLIEPLLIDESIGLAFSQIVMHEPDGTTALLAPKGSGLISTQKALFGIASKRYGFLVSPGCYLARREPMEKALLQPLLQELRLGCYASGAGPDLTMALRVLEAYPAIYYADEPLTHFLSHPGCLSKMDSVPIHDCWDLAFLYFLETLQIEDSYKRKLLWIVKKRRPQLFSKLKDFTPDFSMLYRSNQTLNVDFLSEEALRMVLGPWVARARRSLGLGQ